LTAVVAFFYKDAMKPESSLARISPSGFPNNRGPAVQASDSSTQRRFLLRISSRRAGRGRRGGRLRLRFDASASAAPRGGNTAASRIKAAAQHASGIRLQSGNRLVWVARPPCSKSPPVVLRRIRPGRLRNLRAAVAANRFPALTARRSFCNDLAWLPFNFATPSACRPTPGLHFSLVFSLCKRNARTGSQDLRIPYFRVSIYAHVNESSAPPQNRR
jgi:hypothetical protein